eukprot:4493813-Pleurochrysis_carterae.AAC.1
MGTSPLRTDTAANARGDITEVTLQAGAFMAWVLANPKYQPSSMLQRLRGVARVHKALGYAFGPLACVIDVCKGATQQYIVEHGFEALIPRRKEPLTNEMLIGM